MKIKFVTFERQDGFIEGLGAEIMLGGELRRNVVAFWTAPTPSDMSAAAKELKKWAKNERHKWQIEKRAYLKSL